MAEQNRDFKGVWIPKDIWLDSRLSAIDKVVFVEIDSLDSDERGCWASNKYIAEFCQCSERTVSESVKRLKDFNYIYEKSFDGRQRELKSNITVRGSLAKFARQDSKNCEAESQNLRESNIENKTINKPTKKESKKASFDAILNAYTSDPQILDLLCEWLKVRKAKRSAMTDRAISMNIDKLDNIAKQSKMPVKKYLEEVICRGWAAFYVINDWSKSKGKPAIINSEDDDLSGIL